MEALQYTLEGFAGPLDLLLQLIAKEKLNILEVSITTVLDQYLEQIQQMEENQMEVESSFLEMASRLVYLKSISLLPKHEEAKELEEELTQQLLQYQLCRAMAQVFTKVFADDTVVREPMVLPKDVTYTLPIDREALALAYQRAYGNGKRFAPPPVEALSGLVHTKLVSVSSQMIRVLKALRRGSAQSYASLFADCKEKSEAIATFLAVLELIRSQRIRIEEDEDCTVQLLEKEKTP